MIGKAVGSLFASARTQVASALLRTRITPNMLSVAGMLITLGAGVCYALGAARPFAWSVRVDGPNCYLALGAAGLILAAACDMLDGAVARLGNRGSRFGAFLDSTLDRFSDFVIYAGIAVAYAAREPANLTFVLLSMLAFFNSFMISYTRARAEDLIGRCSVGFWQRGERTAAILIGSFAYHISALVLQQALLALGTVLRRIGHTKRTLEGKPAWEDARRGPGWVRVQIWRHPRMSWGYDVSVLAMIAWLIFADVPPADVLRALFG